MDADGIARRAVPEADGQGVWSLSPDAGIKFVDDNRQATVAKEPFTGEHVIVMAGGRATQNMRLVKPLRRESRVTPVNLW